MTDREKIARVIWEDCTGDSHGFSNCPESSNICYKMADQILALLKVEGYVKLAKDQTVSADGGWYIPRDFRRVELESK